MHLPPKKGMLDTSEKKAKKKVRFRYGKRLK